MRLMTVTVVSVSTMSRLHLSHASRLVVRQLWPRHDREPHHGGTHGSKLHKSQQTRIGHRVKVRDVRTHAAEGHHSGVGQGAGSEVERTQTCTFNRRAECDPVQ
jgi:hypothetical protein